MVACLWTIVYRHMLLVVEAENKSLWIQRVGKLNSFFLFVTLHPPPPLSSLDFIYFQTVQFFYSYQQHHLAFHHYFSHISSQLHHFLPNAIYPVESARFPVLHLFVSSKLPLFLIIIMQESNLCSLVDFFFLPRCDLEGNLNTFQFIGPELRSVARGRPQPHIQGQKKDASII